MLGFPGAGAAQQQGAEIPAAVGRIVYGATFRPGTAICTGTLIAPDTVLTAGHCALRQIGNPGTILFQFAWNGQAFAASARGVRVDPAIAGGTAAGADPKLLADLALITLDHAISLETAVPLPVTERMDAPYRLGWRRDLPDSPEPAVPCPVMRDMGALLAVDCVAHSGNSGAPLLVDTETGPAVLAVTVASSRPPGISFALRPPQKAEIPAPAPDR